MASAETWGAKGKSDVFLFDPEDIVIVTDPEHPLYDERVKLPVDEAMVRNIMVHGVLQPVGVRKNGDAVECVYGRQRVRCAIEANKRLEAEGKQRVRVRATVVRTKDVGDLMGIFISENEIRRDELPSVRAEKLQRFIAAGRTHEEAAIVFGVSESTIRNRLALLDIEPAVLKLVDAGTIGETFAAKELSQVPREEQMAKVDELRAAGTLNGAAAKENIRRLRENKPAEQKKRTRARDVIEAARKRLKKAGTQDALLVAQVLKWVLGEPCMVDVKTVAEALEPSE